MKQHSESCIQNQSPILNIIKPLLVNTSTVLEIGSGTGQHAVFFSEQMPHLTWQASDQSQYLPSVNAWINEASLDNLPSAIELDVTEPWVNTKVEAVFSANTAHIMSWEMVVDFLMVWVVVLMLAVYLSYTGLLTTMASTLLKVMLTLTYG